MSMSPGNGGAHRPLYVPGAVLRQVTLDDLGCASSLVGDDGAEIAVVVDPRFEIDVYVDLARYNGVRIEHVLKTLDHADHACGHGRVALATGGSVGTWEGAGHLIERGLMDC